MVSKLIDSTAVVPVPIAYSSAWALPTWDRFLIPKPFGRVVVMYGEALHVPRDASSDELEESRIELERRLVAITEAAERKARGDDAVPV